MTSRSLRGSLSLSLLCLLLFSARPAAADSGHARIVRLSVVQGDVRFARDFKGNPLDSGNATWETAEPNLPVRQGYVLATDKGRAEVEFENGAMAFLGDDTVLEFYDLSLEEGTKTTRLILRQGTASFYVTPSSGDYFSVTGGDFTVEANQRTTFRLENYDDGSVVQVSRGRVNVLRKNKPTEVAKGQELSFKAGDENSQSIGKLPGSDDFDRWVSGRIDMTLSATAAATPYVGSGYSYGAADLYTYGSWYSVSGCGMCWRPYGVGYGWSPFAAGGWYMDPFYGTAFIGSEPWGWLPYHFGGWYFDPFLGWVWDPATVGGFYGGGYGYIPWVGANAVFVRSKPGLLGIVPVHPLDVRGKTPINLARGVFPVTNGVVATQSVAVNSTEGWKVVKNPPRDTITPMHFASVSAPVATSRSLVAGNFGTRGATVNRSSLSYDAQQHRFVSGNASAAASQMKVAPRNLPSTLATQRTLMPAASVRSTAMVPRSFTPPSAPRSALSVRGGGSAGGGGNFGAGAAARASAPAMSAPAHASAAPSGGGRVH